MIPWKLGSIMSEHLPDGGCGLAPKVLMDILEEIGKGFVPVLFWRGFLIISAHLEKKIVLVFSRSKNAIFASRLIFGKVQVLKNVCIEMGFMAFFSFTLEFMRFLTRLGEIGICFVLLFDQDGGRRGEGKPTSIINHRILFL